MFTGVLTALVTPMREGRVDLGALRGLVEWQVECGVDGLVPCGTTGEAATLDAKERAQVVRTTVEAAGGRVKVLAGAGTSSTQATIEHCRSVLAEGADGVLVICPYYNKPTQDGLVAHYRAVLDAIEAPLVLYNIPGRTGVDMLPATVARVAENPRLVGIKEATGSIVRAAELVKRLDPRVAVLAGDDPLYLPVLAVGGRGIISATACVAPREMVAVHKAWKAGQVETAREAYLQLLELIDALFCETNPGPAKAALQMMGRIEAGVRLPLVWPSAASLERIRVALRGLGLVER